MDNLTVSEFLEKTEKIFNTVTVKEDENIKNIIEKMIENRVDRVIYVVDEENKIKGVISLGDLARHYCSDRIFQSKSIYPSSGIIQHLTAETAKDLMITKFFSVKLSDNLDEILDKMVKYKILKVIPVIDEENKVVSSLDILDIIEYKLG